MICSCTVCNISQDPTGIIAQQLKRRSEGDAVLGFW